MKETYYFSHDYNARNDDKIRRLIRDWWMKWYWIYWSLIEDLYNNNNQLTLDYEWLDFDLRIDDLLCIKSIVNDYNLFIIEDGIFYSKSVGERLEKRDQKSQLAKEKALKRWGKNSGEDTTAMQLHSSGNTIKEIKVKEIKIKEKKEKEISLQEKVFEDFWNLYPKKVDRKNSSSKFLKIKEKEISRVMEWLKKYLHKWTSEWTEKQFIPNPTTWLHQERWNDEISIWSQITSVIEVKKEENKKQLDDEIKKSEEITKFKQDLMKIWNSLSIQEQEQLKKQALENVLKSHPTLKEGTPFIEPLLKVERMRLIKMKIWKDI